MDLASSSSGKCRLPSNRALKGEDCPDESLEAWELQDKSNGRSGPHSNPEWLEERSPSAGLSEAQSPQTLLKASSYKPYLRTLVPNTLTGMDSGPRVLKQGVYADVLWASAKPPRQQVLRALRTPSSCTEAPCLTGSRRLGLGRVRVPATELTRTVFSVGSVPGGPPNQFC